MDHAYAAADIALCRAGAGTVAELAIVGLPAVLVPYPFAPDDHQTMNAAALVDAGAAVLVRDDEATPERLGPQIEELLRNPERLTRMAAAARSQARPEAAQALAAWVLELGRRG
jgi:UDP-N-acetylglucosamine--N-acetylmuramyl-(pentapeptide) pyrophosphoryl-undecaprenol N-acetylglucosamine transferase